MPGRKMDPMRALQMAKQMRAQNRMEMGDPKDRSEMEGFGIPVTDPGGPGPEMIPISQLSQAELNRLGIGRRGPNEALRRMEASAAFPESDPMTGMTDSEAFPESQTMATRPNQSFDRMSVQPGGRMPAMTPSDSMNLLESIRGSTDYGNAFAETTAMSSPERFDARDSLDDVPGLFNRALNKAKEIFQMTGSVPSGISREIGKLDALMNTKKSMEAADDRALEMSMLGRNMEIANMAPTIEDARKREIRARSRLGDIAEAMNQVSTIEGGEDEIEPAMEKFDSRQTNRLLRDAGE